MNWKYSSSQRKSVYKILDTGEIISTVIDSPDGEKLLMTPNLVIDDPDTFS